jgi:hypothetical protein
MVLKNHDPLVQDAEKIIGLVLDSGIDKIPKNRVPDINFFLEFLKDILTYREIILDPDKDYHLVFEIREALLLKERLGQKLGFQERFLQAVMKAVTKQTQSLGRIKWMRKIIQQKTKN